MTVDEIHSERWTTAGTFTMLSSSRLYVGGADLSNLLPGLGTRNDFIGCLRKVIHSLFQDKKKQKNKSVLVRSPMMTTIE